MFARCYLDEFVWRERYGRTLDSVFTGICGTVPYSAVYSAVRNVQARGTDNAKYSCAERFRTF
jgi:hypothetical protein